MEVSTGSRGQLHSKLLECPEMICITGVRVSNLKTRLRTSINLDERLQRVNPPPPPPHPPVSITLSFHPQGRNVNDVSKVGDQTATVTQYSTIML